MRSDIISYSINDSATKEVIQSFYRKFNMLLDPHGAVGWAALLKYRNEKPIESENKAICFETADPAKFPDQIIELTHKAPNIPLSLRNIQDKNEHRSSLEIDTYRDFKAYIQKNFYTIE